jgi:hypothetical protein
LLQPPSDCLDFRSRRFHRQLCATKAGKSFIERADGTAGAEGDYLRAHIKPTIAEPT